MVLKWGSFLIEVMRLPTGAKMDKMLLLVAPLTWACTCAGVTGSHYGSFTGPGQIAFCEK